MLALWRYRERYLLFMGLVGLASKGAAANRADGKRGNQTLHPGRTNCAGDFNANGLQDMGINRAPLPIAHQNRRFPFYYSMVYVPRCKLCMRSRASATRTKMRRVPTVATVPPAGVHSGTDATRQQPARVWSRYRPTKATN